MNQLKDKRRHEIDQFENMSKSNFPYDDGSISKPKFDIFSRAMWIFETNYKVYCNKTLIRLKD